MNPSSYTPEMAAVAPVEDPISSPTPSSMTSSFVILSDHHRSPSSSTRRTSSSDDSDDEIVYSVSEGLLSSPSPSDDDFVVLSRPRSPRVTSPSGPSTPSAADGARTPNIMERLADNVAQLVVSDSGSPDSGKKPQKRSPRSPSELEAAKNRRKRKAARKAATAKVAVESYPSPAPSPARSTPPSSTSQQAIAKVKPGKKKKAKKAPTSGFTTRSIVDDVSERLSVNGETESTVGTPSIYEEAVRYISSCVTPPFVLLIYTITSHYSMI